MKLIIRLLISAGIVLLGAYFIRGIAVDGFLTAIIVAVVLAIVNTFIKPVLKVLTLPITFFTLGLFLLVINAALVMLAGYLIEGFIVEGFLPALILGVVLSVFNSVRNK